MKNKIVEINKEFEIKGTRFFCKCKYYYDEENDEYYDDIKLGDENLKNVRNEYRKINGLLTDDEIKDIRNRYGLSQKDFSLLLGFGEVTITRYESKLIQDPSQDEIIRMAKNARMFYKIMDKHKENFIKEYSLEKYESVKANVKNLFEKANENIYSISSFDKEENGNFEFKTEKFLSIVSEIIKCNGPSTKTKLAKLLFYIDFYFFKQNGESMSGLVYKHLPYGAFPCFFDDLLQNKNIEIETCFNKNSDDYYYLIKNCKGKSSLLKKKEKDTIAFICNKFKNYSSKEIVEYMHNETAYKNTKHLDIISYNFAKELSLD